MSAFLGRFFFWDKNSNIMQKSLIWLLELLFGKIIVGCPNSGFYRKGKCDG